MKRITLVMVYVLLVGVLSVPGHAQVLKNSQDAPVIYNRTSEPQKPQQVKGGGDVIWQTTFNWKDISAPLGWTLPDGWIVKDNTDLGNTWTWRNDSIKGKYTSVAPAKHFATPEDGFICLPMDEYNSRNDIVTSNAMDSYITTPPIDCSRVSSVMVKFNQEFRLCCKDYNIEMLVTNDGGVHWASYEIRFGIRGNTTTPPKFQSPEINISDVAAGLDSVQIKFYVHGMERYYMMLDDLRLVEAFQNDLVLADTWTEFNAGFDDPIGHLNYLPYKQIGMDAQSGGKIGDFRLRGAFLNNGMMDQEDVALNAVVLRNGVEYYNKTSPKSTIWTLERDTLTIADPFRPTEYGDYEINLSAVSANPEEVPANNSTKASVTVNDSLFQRADFSAEAGISSGAWTTGGKAGDLMANTYNIQAPCEINSISAYLTVITETGIPTMQFVLYKYMAENDDYAELLTSEIIDFDSTMERSRITLPLGKDGESEFLQPGEYLAAIRTWGSDGTDGMDIGWDLSTKFPSGYSVRYTVTDNSWGAVDKLTMIGMNLNEKSGPTEAPVTFNVDMTKHIAGGEFKPGTDNVDVTGLASSWSGTAAMSDPDGDGIYSATVNGLTVASVLNYKYRLNGTPEAFPLTGNPYRSFTVRYWNIINDSYNGGVTSGINPSSLMASFNVYPNPTSGAFTVDITSTVASNLVISLTNIQGQVIYQNKVANSVTYQESIDQKLSKGIYFLSVNNGKENRVQKVVVQ
jgi:hypothetical protein